jgi:hypothetical protein
VVMLDDAAEFLEMAKPRSGTTSDYAIAYAQAVGTVEIARALRRIANVLEDVATPEGTLWLRVDDSHE